MGMGVGFIVAISLYLLFFAFITYACIVADPETSRVARVMTQTLPDFVVDKLQKILGPKVVGWLQRASEHGLQAVYLVVVLGSWSIMFTYGYEMITQSAHVSSYHKYSGYVVFILCMGSWWYACRVGPGNITSRTMVKFDNYPYDNLMFVNRECPTLKIRKLPRSKYDRFTNRHVPRFDHFCGWINQPVGEENYRFFIAFLSVHVCMCWYGSFVTGNIFWGVIKDQELLKATFFNATTGQEVKASSWVVVQYVMFKHFYLTGVFLLMAVMAVVLSGFLGFHLYITARGMTTNEHYKWGQVRKWHKAEKKKYELAVKEGKIDQNGVKSPTSMSNGSGNPTTLNDDVDVGCTGATEKTTVISETVTEKDGVTTVVKKTVVKKSNSTTSGKDVEGNADDVIIDPGPMPKYIYDLGIVENFKEVLFPRSLRQDAIDRWEDWLKKNSNGEIPAEVEGKTKAS